KTGTDLVQLFQRPQVNEAVTETLGRSFRGVPPIIQSMNLGEPASPHQSLTGVTAGNYTLPAEGLGRTPTARGVNFGPGLGVDTVSPELEGIINPNIHHASAEQTSYIEAVNTGYLIAGTRP